MANVLNFNDTRVTLIFKVKSIDTETSSKFTKNRLKGFNEILEFDYNVLCKRNNIAGKSIKHSTLFNKLQDRSCEEFSNDMMEVILKYYNKDELSLLLLNIYQKQQSQQNSIEQLDSSFINTKGNIQSSKKVDDLKNEIRNNKETFKTLLSKNKGDKDLKFKIINILISYEDEKYYKQLLDIKEDKVLNTINQYNNEESTVKINDMYTLQYFKNTNGYDINYIAYSLKFVNIEFDYNVLNLINILKEFDSSEYIDIDNICGKYIEILDDIKEDQKEFINTLLESKARLKYKLDNFIPKQESENYQLYIDNKKNIGVENKFTSWNDNDFKIHIFALSMAYKSKYKQLSKNLAKKIHISKYEDLEVEAQKLLKFQGTYAFNNPTEYSAYDSFYEKLNIEIYQNELEKRIESMKASLRIDYEKSEKKKQDFLNWTAVAFTVFGGLGFFLALYDMFYK